MKALIMIVFMLFAAVGCQPKPRHPKSDTVVRVDSVFLKEYVVKKMNEHELRLISVTDTVTIYMENTYCFDERVVFIKK